MRKATRHATSDRRRALHFRGDLLEIRGSAFVGYTAVDGGGIYLVGGRSVLTGLDLRGNGAGQDGGDRQSPAIDAADPSACPAADQRGDPRPQGGGCDVGAVEAY